MTKKNRIEQYIKNLTSNNYTVEQINQAVDRFLDSEEMYAKLREGGYPDRLDYPNTTAYINALKPLNEDFIEIVIKSMQKLKYKVEVIPFLRASKVKYNGSILIPIFNNSTSLEKWFICEAIIQNPPLNISSWVKEIYLSKEYGYSETGLLPLAIVKMFPRYEARAILKQGFDHHNRVTPEALGKVGEAEDIPFLEEKLHIKYEASHVRKDIQKAIDKIKKRAKLT